MNTYTYTCTNVDDSNNWEGAEGCSRAEALGELREYCHPENSWALRPQKPTMQQYADVLLALSTALRERHRRFVVVYGGQWLELEATK